MEIDGVDGQVTTVAPFIVSASFGIGNKDYFFLPLGES